MRKKMTVSGPEKLLYITLGIMFLALGVVGLIIPIIPGVLFLAGAVYMLSRGSRRVKQFTDANPTISRMQARVEKLDAVSIAEKVQVTGLTMLQAIAVGSRKVAVGVRRLFA